MWNERNVCELAPWECFEHKQSPYLCQHWLCAQQGNTVTSSSSQLAVQNRSDHFFHQCWGWDRQHTLVTVHTQGRKSIGGITSIINVAAATLGIYCTVTVADTSTHQKDFISTSSSWLNNLLIGKPTWGLLRVWKCFICPCSKMDCKNARVLMILCVAPVYCMLIICLWLLHILKIPYQSTNQEDLNVWWL